LLKEAKIIKEEVTEASKKYSRQEIYFLLPTMMIPQRAVMMCY